MIDSYADRARASTATTSPRKITKRRVEDRPGTLFQIAPDGGNVLRSRKLLSFSSRCNAEADPLGELAAAAAS
jgi:hypothetical protein